MEIIDLDFNKKEESQKIVFEEFLNEGRGKFESSCNSTEDWDYIAFLYTYKGKDYMLAWDEGCEDKCIYRGKFNR